MRHLNIVLFSGLLAASPAWAQEINQLQTIVQGQFRLLSEDLGAALSYHAQTPTTPLGITGFDLGVGVTATKLEHVAILESVTSDTADTTLFVPTLRLHKGLPAGFDFGLTYASIPGSNIKYTGGELRYALLEGGAASPAIGVRGSFTRLSGVDQLALSTRGLDISISKGFAVFTPYAGIGRVWVESDPRGTAGFLQTEKFALTKVFVGIGMNFAVLNLNLQADKTGDASSYSLKLGWRF
ncbi:MAG: hypothetical protein OEO84_13165 [Betaproteobacteria bacterium]|nr:hypothetical protein [Betaproteobacteria bacterium]